MHGDETLKQQNYHHTNLQKSSSQQQQHKLPRWFIISPIVILCIVFLGLVYSNLSMAGKWREEIADEYGYPLRLRPGWFLNRKMDQSDFQWSSFRKFLPILAGSALIYSVISRWLFRNTEQAGKNIGPNGAIFQYHVVSSLHSSFDELCFPFFPVWYQCAVPDHCSSDQLLDWNKAKTLSIPTIDHMVVQSGHSRIK